MFRFFSTILICVLFTGTLPTVAAAADQDMWSKANPYMADSLREAQVRGLIPEILKGGDFTQPMTRAEFAHLIVLMLETYTGVSTQPETLVYPFKDTEDPTIFTAYGFGIMDRTDDKEALFSPDIAIDRETMAYMASRAIRLVAPLADYSISENLTIPDIGDVSSWAERSVKYLYAQGIIVGGNNHAFMPRPITDAQKEGNYGIATREQCVVLANRIFNALPQIQDTRFSVEEMTAEIMRSVADEPQNGVEISRDDLWAQLNPYSLKVRWASNTHALSFTGDFRKTGGGGWEKGYDSFFLYNAYSSGDSTQFKYDEQQTLWGGAAGTRRFALTVFDAENQKLSAYEWDSLKDTGTLNSIPAHSSSSLFSPMSLRDYLPSRIDWGYKSYDEAVINGERCKVFSVTTKENMIQGEGPNLPEHWVDKTEYFYVSTVSGLNVLTTNYQTTGETTYLALSIVFTISPSLTDAGEISPPSNITFSL